MRKVLFVAYYFPPVGGSGVYRSAKFAKYLPQFGWQPYVVSTMPEPGITETDHSLLDDIPEIVRIWRVTTPRPQPYRRMRRLLRDRVRQRGDSAVSKDVQTGLASRVESRLTVRRRIKQFLSCPLRIVQKPPIDNQLYWSLRIIPLVRRLARQYDIDLIYTSSSPYSVLLSGIILRNLIRTPWVADFRDPWTTNEIIYRHRGARLTLDRSIERKALLAADRVVCANRWMADTYSRMLDEHHAGDKFCVITNGFDSEDFQNRTVPSTVQREELRLAHFGTMTHQAVSVLVEGVTRLAESDHLAAWLDRLQIHLFGFWMNPADQCQITNSKVSRIFHIHGTVPHTKAVSLMRQSDALLLFIEDSPYWATIHRAKLFEYMASGSPILAIAPEGVAAELIRESCTGCTVHPKDRDGLVLVLKQIVSDYDVFKARCYQPQAEVIERYDRRILARHLAGVFDSVISKPS